MHWIDKTLKKKINWTKYRKQAYNILSIAPSAMWTYLFSVFRTVSNIIHTFAGTQFLFKYPTSGTLIPFVHWNCVTCEVKFKSNFVKINRRTEGNFKSNYESSL